MPRPPMTWADLCVGSPLGPYVYVVTQAVADDLRACVGDRELVEVQREAVAPAMLLTFPFLQLLEQAFEPPPGVVHAEQEFDLLAAVRVGATLAVTGVVAAKFLRRSRRYYQVAAQAHDDRGVLVARSVTTGVFPDAESGPSCA